MSTAIVIALVIGIGELFMLGVGRDIEPLSGRQRVRVPSAVRTRSRWPRIAPTLRSLYR